MEVNIVFAWLRTEGVTVLLNEVMTHQFPLNVAKF
jgi:hypothetical protein